MHREVITYDVSLLYQICQMSAASFLKDHPGQAPVLLVGLGAGRVPGLPSCVSLHLCLPCPGRQTLMDTVSGWTGWFPTFL